jgi:molybdopterin converting factor small subunit
MKVRLQFFSRIRDVMGASEMEVDVPIGSTATDLLDALYSNQPSLRTWDKSILVASGLEFVERDYLLKPDDRISIMPPLQGG